MTVKQFLLKKFPTKDYFDCPVPKEHWETIQEFADQEVAAMKKDFDVMVGNDSRQGKEIERLNKLLEKSYFEGYSFGLSATEDFPNNYKKGWIEFKKLNNL